MNTNEQPGIGHNKADPAQALNDSAEQLALTCNAWLMQVSEIETEDQAAKATDFRERVKAETKEAEKTRKAEKQPHIDAGKAVDAKFNPIKQKLETIEALFRPLLNGWLQKKEAARREAERKAEAEALEKIRLADEATKAAEDAVKASEGGDVVGATIAADEAAKAAEDAVKQADDVSNSTVSVKGNYSARKTGLRTTSTAEIISYPALLEHYKDHPRIKKTLDQLAGEWARSPEQRQTPLPGVKLVTSQSV